MNLYIISGLGADYKVLEKLEYPSHIQPVFIPWKIPHHGESLTDFCTRMSDCIDPNTPFCLLGYSFGGIVVQEINKIKPAKKTIILGSIKSHQEKSKLIKLGKMTKIPRLIPQYFYGKKTLHFYDKIREKIQKRKNTIDSYFQVRDAYYLKWSLEKITEWKSEETQGIIQIMGDKDWVFPIKNSRPEYVIKGGTHLFPVTKHRAVSKILAKIL